MKCAYKYCKENHEVSKEEAIQDNGKYYHFDCYEKKKSKAKIYDLFCSYVTNQENGTFIKKKIKDYIDVDGVDASYCLFALNYAIKNKITLRSIFGIPYLLKNKKIKEEYDTLINSHQNVEIKEENTFVYTKDNMRKNWSDLIE